MELHELRFLSGFIRQETGIVLTDDKTYLLESRLAPVLQKFKIPSIPHLIQLLQAHKNRALIEEVIDAMTTNESLFFRDGRPFEALRKQVLPLFRESRSDKKSLRILSAACSEGQEAYSIAICMQEEWGHLKDWRIEIVGTDISKRVLEKAKAGTYSDFEINRGMPQELRNKYFTHREGKWHIRPALKELVHFRNVNLLDSHAHLGEFDIVFCRNVLIYFDDDTKRKVLEALARVMRKDGVLIVGTADHITSISDRFAFLDRHNKLYKMATA